MCRTETYMLTPPTGWNWKLLAILVVRILPEVQVSTSVVQYGCGLGCSSGTNSEGIVG